jgi:hypothetical protein
MSELEAGDTWKKDTVPILRENAFSEESQIRR